MKIGTEELYFHESDKNEWYNLAGKPEFNVQKEKLARFLPKNEAPTVEEFISPWSVEGFEREKYRVNKGNKKKKNKNK